MSALPKDFRLRKTIDYNNVYQTKALSIKTKRFVFLVKQNEEKTPRLGIVVRKKLIKQAVKRNYIRRVLKSLFYMNRDSFKSVDIIAILIEPVQMNIEKILKDWQEFNRALQTGGEK